jgi:hypothetical protein
MLMIRDDETREGHKSPEHLAKYGPIDRLMRERNAVVFAAGLQPTAASATVRVRDGKALITDGPYAETKEQLGGFYIVECKDLDEALGYARQIPTAEYGSVEVRPLA